MRALDNYPHDPITMSINGMISLDMLSFVEEQIQKLNLGTLNTIQAKKITTPNGDFLCYKFTVIFQKWDPLNDGAKIRHELQTTGFTELYDKNGVYLWKVTYKSHISVSQKGNGEIKKVNPYKAKK